MPGRKNMVDVSLQREYSRSPKKKGGGCAPSRSPYRYGVVKLIESGMS